MLSLDSGAKSVHEYVFQVLGVVVFARRQRVKATGKAIYGGVEAEVIVVGEDDVEVSV